MARHRADSARRGDTKDTPAELNFDEDRSQPPHNAYARMGSVEHEHAAMYDEGGLSPTVDNTASADDLAPETMLDETGGDTPLVSGDAADTSLSIVNADDIGAGDGLDEAELAVAEGGGPSASDDREADDELVEDDAEDDEEDGDEEDEEDDEDDDDADEDDEQEKDGGKPGKPHR